MKIANKKTILICAILIIALVVGAVFLITNLGKNDISDKCVSESVNADLSSYTSVNGIVSLGENLYVSDETGKHIYKLSSSGEILKTYTSEKQVNRVVGDGENIYCLEGGLDGCVVKLSQDLETVSTVNVGHTPNDMATYNGKGYVLNRFSNTVSVLSLSDMKISSTVEIDGREPTAATVAGENIYIACHLPDEASTENVISANVAVISSKTDTVTSILPLINGASGVKGICSSPDGKTVYVSHIIGRYAYPTTQLDRGWINTNAVTVIDSENHSVVCSCLLDEVDLGAANPWGITVSADSKYLCVALSGLNEVMVIDRDGMHTKINNVVDQDKKREVESTDDIANYLPFLDGCRTRVNVGTGVRNITEKDGTLYCGLYFDGAVDTVNLSDLSVNRISFKAQPEASTVRQGQILWSDANNCYQKWQSCNSCHPDGVVDGFNWDNLNDGLGNAKSAKSMLYSHRTPPVMVTGIRENAEIAVTAGMKYIQFNTLDETSLSYIDEYLKSLYPLQSPYLNSDATLTESATLGKTLFEQNCASCHTGPYFTDMKMHSVDNSNTEFDTPTLIEVWRTAPYMHDGSLNTVEEVVKHFAPELSDSEVTQLSDYVRSICGIGEYYGIEQVKGVDSNGKESYNVYRNGSTLKTITVRRQLAQSPDNIKVILNVFDKDGKSTYKKSFNISDMICNSTVIITLEDEITLPDGGYYTVSITDKKNEPVATVLTVK